MRLTYDKEADILYIHLLEDEYQCRVVRLTDDIVLDFAAGEQLIGIEVLGASHLFEKPEEIDLKNLLPHVVAAQRPGSDGPLVQGLHTPQRGPRGPLVQPGRVRDRAIDLMLVAFPR